MHVLVCCGFACLGWGKLTLIKKFLFGLNMVWDQELSSGLIDAHVPDHAPLWSY